MKNQIKALLYQSLLKLNETYDIPKSIVENIRIDRTRDKSHGDFATNLAMVLTKVLHQNPRQIAELIVAGLPKCAAVSKTEIAGAGFINFFVSIQAITDDLEAMNRDPRLGVMTSEHPDTIVVDYSAPNVAKEMAVHHIRSTVIGDACVRILEFLGHKVIRANHIGDWGTQFGMLIAYLEQQEAQNGADFNLSDFEAFYREAKACYDQDPAFAAKARNYVVQLQSGDEYCRTMWRRLVDITMAHNQEIYRRLDVTLTEQDTMGESLYNDMLPHIVDDLLKKGIAVEDKGAVVVFLPQFKNKNGEPIGEIVRKSDGGFLYTTTDIACVKYRVETLKANRLMYFIDSRQHQHLQSAWAIARMAGYADESIIIEHDAFGMMLGSDGRPYKTRSGGTVKLKELLDEAEARAADMLKERSPNLTGIERQQVIHNIAVGAVKYADLSKNRTTDYIFDWSLMLSFEGNTAPYLQYAYSRIKSIERRADIDPGPLILREEAEIDLAGKLLAFPETINEAAQKAMPHLLCTYLYELAGLFMHFYEHCPVLKAGVPGELKAGRLSLCSLTAKVLKQGLNLLGINVMEHM